MASLPLLTESRSGCNFCGLIFNDLPQSSSSESGQFGIRPQFWRSSPASALSGGKSFMAFLEESSPIEIHHLEAVQWSCDNS